MISNRDRLAAFLEANPVSALIRIIEAKGSTPREQGAWMLAAPAAMFGTIGGGQLEFLAIDRAREILANGTEGDLLDVPLGPEIGQCCGGRVKLRIAPLDDAMGAELLRGAEAEESAVPEVYLFGGGHVGQALSRALALLPLKVIVVETRAEALEGMPDTVETHLTPVPEEFVRQARPGSAFVILTHDHALDFLIVAEALKRDDAAYVGMIGSATKKATFRSWYLKNADGSEHAFARLATPIGGDAVRDKRPAVIAAMAAAEIMAAMSLSLKLSGSYLSLSEIDNMS